MKNEAFTLAEIMIVLSIIGILTAILLPTAINSAPDENIMKFKKANTTLGMVIRELVNSDKYYLNGDLGIKADGNLIDGTHTGDNTYFCETFADNISTKKVDCFSNKLVGWADIDANDSEKLNEGKNRIDTACDDTEGAITSPEIISTDGISYWITSPNIPFGISIKQAHIAIESGLGYTNPIRQFGEHVSTSGFIYSYRIFCFDVDGINKGVPPFGYGIRVDGRILPGARADEWINKSVQSKD